MWDFYKPVLESEYPKVDGHLSNECYLRSLDNCYTRYAQRFEQTYGSRFTLDEAAFAVFHAPYNKLVQKSFGRYLYMDYLRFPRRNAKLEAAFRPFEGMTIAETYVNKQFQETLKDVSKAAYTSMVAPSEMITSELKLFCFLLCFLLCLLCFLVLFCLFFFCFVFCFVFFCFVLFFSFFHHLISRTLISTEECGNSYCGSLYAGLLSLIQNKAEVLPNKRVLMFSYGSGLAATQFSINVKGDVTGMRRENN